MQASATLVEDLPLHLSGRDHPLASMHAVTHWGSDPSHHFFEENHLSGSQVDSQFPSESALTHSLQPSLYRLDYQTP